MGGATWSGGAADPARGLLFVNTNDVGAVGLMKEQPPGAPLAYRRASPWGDYARFWDTSSLPCQQPPWGQLHAVDLVDRRHPLAGAAGQRAAAGRRAASPAPARRTSAAPSRPPAAWCSSPPPTTRGFARSTRRRAACCSTRRCRPVDMPRRITYRAPRSGRAAGGRRRRRGRAVLVDGLRYNRGVRSPVIGIAIRAISIANRQSPIANSMTSLSPDFAGVYAVPPLARQAGAAPRHRPRRPTTPCATTSSAAASRGCCTAATRFSTTCRSTTTPSCWGGWPARRTRCG